MDYIGITIVFSCWAIGCISVSLIAYLFSVEKSQHPHGPAAKCASKPKYIHKNVRIGFLLRYAVSLNRKGRSEYEQENTEKRKDRALGYANLFVLFITLLVLSATCLAIVKQVEEMKRAYDPIKAQADAATRGYALVAKIDGVDSVDAWIDERGLIEANIIIHNYAVPPAVIVEVKCGVFWGYDGTPPDGAISMAVSQNHDDTARKYQFVVDGGKDSEPIDCGQNWAINKPGLVDSPNGGVGNVEPQTRREAFRTYPIWIVGTIYYESFNGGKYYSNYCFVDRGWHRLSPSGGDECRKRN